MDQVLKNQVVESLAFGNAGAKEAIQKLLPRDSANGDLEHLYLLGYCHFILGEWERARDCFFEAHGLNADEPDILFFLGLADANCEPRFHKSWGIRRDCCKESLHKAEKILGAGVTAWSHLETCLETLATAASYVGPEEDAEYAYRQLLAIHPDNAAYLTALARIRAEVDIQDSLRLLEQVEVSPNDLGMHEDKALLRDAISMAGIRKKSPVARSKYPSTAEMRGELREVIAKTLASAFPQEKLLDSQKQIFCLGSCFAREIALQLQARDFTTMFIEMSEHINSTYANRSLVDWAMGDCDGQPKDRITQLCAEFGVTPASLLESLRSSHLVIYTLGVAPVFVDKQNNNQFVMPTKSTLSTSALAELYDFRTTSVQENVENLEYILQRLRSINPAIRMVVTVSPVPLRTSFEFKSAMMADSLSKATLRLAAHEFVTAYPDVIYWPSFEIVRWIGGHVGPFIGGDDGSSFHVNEDVIKAITDAFIAHYS